MNSLFLTIDWQSAVVITILIIASIYSTRLGFNFYRKVFKNGK